MHSIPGNSPTCSPACFPRRNSNHSDQASAWAYNGLCKGYRAGERRSMPLNLNRTAGPKFDGPAGLICDSKDCKGHSGRTVRIADKRNDDSGSPWAFPWQNRLHNQQAHECNREINCDFERPTHGGILCERTSQAQRRRPRDASVATAPDAAVRCVWLGRVRNLTHTPQKYIRVTEI